MGKIFYLMGKSSSGKDTIYKQLLKRNNVALETIVLYTTRPIRVGEVDGVQYHFVTDEMADQLKMAGKVVEMRCYDTCHGIWKYFTVADEHIDVQKKDYVIIGTIESYVKSRDYFGNDVVVPIMIELDDGIRLQRALDREKREEHPKYEEMCRRFLADSEDFSEDKKQAAGITHSFYNEDLETCLQEIEEYMRKQSNGY